MPSAPSSTFLQRLLGRLSPPSRPYDLDPTYTNSSQIAGPGATPTSVGMAPPTVATGFAPMGAPTMGSAPLPPQRPTSTTPVPPQRPWDLDPTYMGTAQIAGPGATPAGLGNAPTMGSTQVGTAPAPAPVFRPLPTRDQAMSYLAGDPSQTPYQAGPASPGMTSAPLPPSRPAAFGGGAPGGGTIALPAISVPSQGMTSAPLPPPRPADLPAPGAIPTVGQIDPGTVPQAPAPTPPADPSQAGWEYYRYLDESGRPVWGTRQIGSQSPAGMPWGDGTTQAGGPGTGLQGFLDSLFGGNR